MQGCFNIYAYLIFGTLKKIIVNDRHPLLYSRIIDQDVQIAMFFCDPIKKTLSLAGH